jgi:hypothetical protein
LAKLFGGGQPPGMYSDVLETTVNGDSVDNEISNTIWLL